MSLETLGERFLHPDRGPDGRNLHARRWCTIEVVQFQFPRPGYDRLSVQGCIQQMLDKHNVDVWMRVDYS